MQTPSAELKNSYKCSITHVSRLRETIYFENRCLRTVSGCHFVPKGWKTKTKPSSIRNYYSEWCGKDILSLQERSTTCRLRIENFSRVPFITRKVCSDNWSPGTEESILKEKCASLLCSMARHFAEYRFEFVYRPWRNRKTADYLSRLRDTMNTSEKAFDYIAVVAKMKMPHGIECKPNLYRWTNFRDGLEVSKIHLEHKNWVWINRKDFTSCDKKFFSYTKTGPRLVNTLKETMKILRTSHDEWEPWDLKKTNQFITERFG